MGIFKTAAFSLFVLLAGTSFRLTAQSYGLQFASRDADPEKRTSLDLTPDETLCVSKKLELSFDLNFIPNNPTYFGYIFRIINDKKQNLDLLYAPSHSEIKLVFGDSYAGINISVKPEELVNRWKKFKLVLDLDSGVALYYDNRLIKGNRLVFKGKCFRICFGASNYVDFKSSDVTPMKVRNILLATDHADKYFWPLDQSSGNMIRDSLRQKKALVHNEHWLKPLHSNWQLLQSLRIKGSPGVGFDPVEEKLMIVSSDSFRAFSAKTALLTTEPLSVKLDNLLPGNQSVFNPYNRRLYDFYIDQQAVAGYNSGTRQWSRSYANADLTNYWQVNKFFSNTDSALYMLGGYGHIHYKNLVQRYSLSNGKWEILSPGGSYFTPRYLAALGATPNGDSAYILGGYGSKDGDQLLNPKYIYDLLLYNVKTRSFKQLFSLKEPTEPFVFANSLVLDTDGKHYYALIYPKEQLNTQLQLIKGSLEQPTYERIGSPFPYTFFDTNSFADIYYCNTAKLFLAVTLYTNKENITELKIYSINYPPNELESVNTPAAGSWGPSWPWITGIILIALLVVAGLAYKNGKSSRSGLSPVPPGPRQADPLIVSERDKLLTGTAITQHARIFLFGNFEVLSGSGENITKLFTPLLKELFLLLCVHSIRYNKGVSPEKLVEALWSNKEGKDAINNRSVNIAKLKSILEKIEECGLQKESGYWKLSFNPEKLYIDFDHTMRIFSEGANNRNIHELNSITQRGPFLPQTDYQWADNIKSEISNFIVDALLKYCDSLTLPAHAERIITVCDSIFSFDELNENALRLKCRSLTALGRHTLAKQAFENFIGRYRESYGEEYPAPYHGFMNK